MLLTKWNVVPTVLTLIIMPIILTFIRPKDEDAVYLEIKEDEVKVELERLTENRTLAQFLEYSLMASIFIGIAGICFGFFAYTHSLPFSDINALVFVMFIAGVVLHGYPLAYANAIKNAVRQAGSLILQFPLYGGIMGIMHATGLPNVIADEFVQLATAYTLPF